MNDASRPERRTAETQQPPRLSKSRFISGMQCRLRLWYACYEPKLATPPDAALQAIFARGHEVGELAQRRWPGGALVEAGPRQVDQAVARTRELLADTSLPALYEAAFVHRGVLTRVDVLVRNDDGSFDLVEVKSSSRVKEPYDTDVAVQYWILKGEGLPVRRAGVLVLNRDYVYDGVELDLQQLFRFEDLTDECEQRLDEISARVGEFQDMLMAEQPPAIEPGDHCHTPYDCPFWNHCTRNMQFPEHPVTMLPGLTGGRLEGLEAMGVETVEEIPADYNLTTLQQRVRESTLSGRPWVSDGLRDALEEVQWPLHFLDFEAAALAIPRFAGMRPFDALPFQFSCHHQCAPGEALEHSEFLATDTGDPRPALAEALVEALGKRGSIIVYSPYERRTINALIQAVPRLEPQLAALRERLVDLLAIIRRHYYHPGFRGSFSIKQVLPALVPEMSYEGMDIADGQAAGVAWTQMLACEDESRRNRIEQALRDYCRMDSRAMHALLEALLREADRHAATK